MHNVYSVRDAKTEVFSPPFLAVNHADALRSFGSMCGNPDTTLFKYPEDFALFHVASFDLQTGRIEPVVQIVQLGLALDFKPKSQSQLPAGYGDESLRVVK